MMAVDITTLEERVIELEKLCRGMQIRLDALQASFEATFKAYSWQIDPLKRQEPAEHEGGGEADLP
jgi:hypothetical protein